MTGARLPSVAIAALCALTAIYLAQARNDAEVLREANQQGLAGRFDAAARTAHGLDRAPADARARLVEAHALEAARRPAAASDAYARAARRTPNDWVVHRDWAVLLNRLRDHRAASREIGRALALNPRMALPAGFVRGGQASGG